MPTPQPPSGRAHASKVNPLVWLAAIVGEVVILGVIASVIDLPRPRTSQTRAQEIRVIKTILTIHTAQAQYFSECGRYAATLAHLGPPPTGRSGPLAADLIPSELASSGEANGYRFILAITPTGYTINANPKPGGPKGGRSLFSDQTLTVRGHSGPEPASIKDPEFK
jgi:hypothetical protein